MQDSINSLSGINDLNSYNRLDTDKVYIYNDTLISKADILIGNLNENIKLPEVFITEIFMTEYKTYYIILDYYITNSLIVSFKNFIKNNNDLPDDIINLICYNLFGYYNLDFLDRISDKYHHELLLTQYILDNKCKFASKDNYYYTNFYILDNKNKDDSYILEDIYNHYSRNNNYKGMFYWITIDALEIDLDT